MNERGKTLVRRSFLLAAAAGGAATAAAIVARPASPSPRTLPAKRGTRGYHASPHADNYYRTAKL